MDFSKFPEVQAAIVGLAGQVHADQKEASLRAAVGIMVRNLSGQVVRQYVIGTDEWQWIFGNIVWPRLKNAATGRRFKDDPMDSRENVPLDEFLTYLADWYHPRLHSQLY